MDTKIYFLYVQHVWKLIYWYFLKITINFRGLIESLSIILKVFSMASMQDNSIKQTDVYSSENVAVSEAIRELSQLESQNLL